MSRRSERDDDFPPDLIDPEEAIDLVIDAVLIGSKPLRRMTKDIMKQQKRLRRSVNDDAWKVFLKLEELLNERASKQMEVLVRWARAAGARSCR